MHRRDVAAWAESATAGDRSVELLGPALEGLVDLLPIEERREQLRKCSRVEPLAACQYLGQRPPPEVEVVLVLEVHSSGAVDRRPSCRQSYRHDHFVVDAPLAAVAEGRPPPPARRTDLARTDHEACFLSHFADDRLAVGLTGLDPPAGQLPPRTQLRVRRVSGVEEQHVLVDVDDHRPHYAPLDDVHPHEGCRRVHRAARWQAPRPTA
jgi:hypothetical protein